MSACMEQLVCHWMVLIFVKYHTVGFLLKYVTQLQLWLEVYANNGHCMKTCKSLRYLAVCKNSTGNTSCHLCDSYAEPEYTVLTQMLDDSNLRRPPQIKHVCQGKMYFSKSKMTLQK